ncbi:MAG: peptidase acyl-coenzyme A:6-aminopenicillanic acid acyl-transferase [Anaerosporomusa subterranea]|jgi:hypothetical protein|nr:peptidase acyl-coenzyme A:6-aminopenicillanic acid acyl-transferase [Anaerosporomusa subterranea]
MAFSGIPAQACTLWAANGNTVEGGGSLIVKNRDWSPDHQQNVKLITPDHGYRYMGLFTPDGLHKGLKAGINEKGLVVVSATAGSIPAKERNGMKYTHALSVRLLKECSSVEEAIAKTNLFVGPQILMIADRQKVATIEIGPEGNFYVMLKENGAIFHTNHYIAEAMLEFNRISAPSSQKRYSRIGELLNSAAQPYDLDTFITFSKDQNDGADNSIFRTGSTPKKTRTMAVWAVSIPQSMSPELYVRILNPGEAERVLRINTEDVFSGKLLLN